MDILKEVMETPKKMLDVNNEAGNDSGHATESDDGEVISEDSLKRSDLGVDDEPPELQIVWPNIFKFIILHGLALYALTLLPSISLATWAWLIGSYIFAGLGITAGAHRLWSHRTYKARLPLRLVLVLANTMAGENSIYTWTRDHRTHHKFSETHGDPHNAKRGFFFSHMGWLCVRKHPAVTKAGRTISMTDLEADPLIMTQHRHYLKCFLVAAFLLPSLIPTLWGEDIVTAYFISVLRYVAVLHFTWLVNSAAHMYGMKPYDSSIGPVENMGVSVLALGEGFHNYHHTFPYDYGTSEWGLRLNVTTRFINAMAKLGFAYDLRTASPSVVAARAARTGHPELTRQGMAAKKSS